MVTSHQNVAVPLLTKVGHGLCHSFCADSWKTLSHRIRNMEGIKKNNFVPTKIFISRKYFKSGRKSCLGNGKQIEELLKKKGFFIFFQTVSIDVQADVVNRDNRG